MQRIEGAVILGSTAHPPRRISMARPKKRSALAFCCIHSRCRRTKSHGGAVPLRVAGTSTLSFMTPFSVTPCATKHDGAFKFPAVTGTDSLFLVSVPVMYSATICLIRRNRTIWGAQAAHSPWDRHPSHNHDFLRRRQTKTTS